MDGEDTLADGRWGGQFGTAGDQGQDFDICGLCAEEVGDRLEREVGDGGEPERAEPRLRGDGREDGGRDGVAREIEVGEPPGVEHGRLRDDLQQVVLGQRELAGHIAEKGELLQPAGGFAVDEEVGHRLARQARAARQREDDEAKSGRGGKAVQQLWRASRAREIEVCQGREC